MASPKVHSPLRPSASQMILRASGARIGRPGHCRSSPRQSFRPFFHAPNAKRKRGPRPLPPHVEKDRGQTTEDKGCEAILCRLSSLLCPPSLQTTNFKLQTPNYKLQTTNFKLQTPKPSSLQAAPVKRDRAFGRIAGYEQPCLDSLVLVYKRKLSRLRDKFPRCAFGLYSRK